MRIYSFKLTVSILISLLFIDSSFALKLKKPVKLTPHRAIYEMTLADNKSSSGITGLRGRLVFELGGSSCNGYTVNMRFVTHVTNQQGGSSLTDLRSSSWESARGHTFRFNSSEYGNSKLNYVISGAAERKSEEKPIKIRLKRPKPQTINAASNTLFPTQHSRKLIAAAQNGETVVQADIYDGSEKGQKVFMTTAIIGKARLPGHQKDLKKIKNAAALDKIASWPVTISYFHKDTSAEVPDYEIAFRLFANGVSQNLMISYDNFSIKGTLKRIDFLKPVKCG